MSEGKRLFSSDPVTGITKWFRYNEASSGLESDDTFSIETTQDATQIVDYAKSTFNSIDERARWGDGQMVACIPLALWTDLKKKGVVDDERRFKRWLNDGDNRFFRTRPGRV